MRASSCSTASCSQDSSRPAGHRDRLKNPRERGRGREREQSAVEDSFAITFALDIGRHDLYAAPGTPIAPQAGVGPVLCVVGARPNFMKIAPLCRELAARGVPYRLVHTGQHYDATLSRVFFEDLGLPEPDFTLGAGSGTHTEQTARVMLAFEPVLQKEKPASVVVVGDVNSTLGCALVAAKVGVPVVHVEAGLRSFDRTMPEETNRLLTDQLSDLCLTPSPDADQNLLREGISRRRIVRVGNVMIDTLLHELPRARAARVFTRFDLHPRQYGIVTLHRPSNVDDPQTLRGLWAALLEISGHLPLLFPVHPRTRAQLESQGILAGGGRSRALHLTPPLGYRDALGLVAEARLVLTDSGGLQEETTALGVPCLTLREQTERPITVEQGTNQIVGTNEKRIVACAREVLMGGGRRGRVPELWDGLAAHRIADALEQAHLCVA